MKTIKDYLQKNEICHLFEMADEKGTYEQTLKNYSASLYHHLIFICSMEDCFPEMVNHWSREIRRFTIDAVITKFKKGARHIDRKRIIEEQMMVHQMGTKFEDYCEEDFVGALNLEMQKQKRDMENPKYRNYKTLMEKEIRCIEKRLKDVEKYVEPNKQRMMEFYKDFIESAQNQDEEMLDETINKFCNNSPSIN